MFQDKTESHCRSDSTSTRGLDRDRIGCDEESRLTCSIISAEFLLGVDFNNPYCVTSLVEAGNKDPPGLEEAMLTDGLCDVICL